MKVILKKFSLVFLFISLLFLGANTLLINASNESKFNDEEIQFIEESDKEIDEGYITPASSDVIYGKENNGTYGNNFTIMSSTKDQYENNNSFQDATVLFTNSAGEPSNGTYSKDATLHRDPWYYLFWRDIDEDYYRFDVLGDAEVTLTLTNIPSGVDYDLEFYKFPNVKYPTFEKITNSEGNDYFKRQSRKASNHDELIQTDVEPGTYYIRVFPYGENSYNDTKSYKITCTINYPQKNTNTNLSDLRYNKGSKAAVWKSDFDPFGIQPYQFYGKEEVGFYSVMEFEKTRTILDYYQNPFHNNLKSRAGNSEIINTVMYVWDIDWRREIHGALVDIANGIDEEVKENQKFVMTFDSITDISGGFFSLISVLALFDPEPYSSAILGTIGTVGGAITTGAQYLIPAMFPEKWDTDKPTALAYIKRLITAFETGLKTNDDETIMLKFQYSYQQKSEILIEHKTYYVNFTPTNRVEEKFIYDSNLVPAFNPEGYLFGETYGLRSFNDIVNFINGEPVKTLPDVNAGEIKVVTTESSESETLDIGEYFWYKFTAPRTNRYVFESRGSTDTYGELFYQMVAAQSTDGLITYDNNSGLVNNFKIEYEMTAGETVYLRVRGANWTETGGFSFGVEEENIEFEVLSLNNYYPGYLNVGDRYWYKFTAPSNGNYIFETIGSCDTYGEVFPSIVSRQNINGRVTSNDDSGSGLNFKIVYKMNANQTVYLRVRGYSWRTTGSYQLIVNKENTISIVMDPSNMLQLGTEVTLNGGVKGGNTMTVGYTRNAYLGSDAPSPSRLQYNWYVSDENIAKISSYGTLTAMRPGTVEVIAIYKGDSTFVGRTTITIYPDSSNELKIINFTTDKRESPKEAGTEVTLNGGIPGETTIHKGFTRFICFNNLVPNAIIQDYMWTSSNSSVLSVDMYGIVTAISYNITVPTLVTITCVYKYNPLYTGTITFTVYP